jgi:hypothetical protein
MHNPVRQRHVVMYQSCCDNRRHVTLYVSITSLNTSITIRCTRFDVHSVSHHGNPHSPVSRRTCRRLHGRSCHQPHITHHARARTSPPASSSIRRSSAPTAPSRLRRPTRPAALLPEAHLPSACGFCLRFVQFIGAWGAFWYGRTRKPWARNCFFGGIPRVYTRGLHA